MCEPTTLAYITLATTVAAGGYSAYSQRQAGKYEQEVAEQNAKVAGLQAEQAKQSGNIEEDRARTRVRQMLGAQRAAFAGQGVEQTGTALDVLGDTAGFGFSDASLIRSNALREAWGFGVDQTNQRQRGRAARYAGNTGAAGTLLTTGGSAAGMWAQSPCFRSGGTGASASTAGPYRSGYRYPGG